VHSEIWNDATARTYDDDVIEMASDEVVGPTVDLLTELAAGGRALEFAVGTGRIAIPLGERGVDVVGIELSQPMIDQMRTKPGAADVPVVQGDMTTTRVDGTFSVVYLVFNTITNLLTQDAQVACFRNAAAHLEPGGCFVVETLVPRLQQLPTGERFVPYDVSDHHIGIDEYDVVNQMLVPHHVSTRADGVTRSSGRFRYAWPAEYDLMARIAGMEFGDRWADWHRSPFTATSASHVSVWRMPR